MGENTTSSSKVRFPARPTTNHDSALTNQDQTRTPSTDQHTVFKDEYPIIKIDSKMLLGSLIIIAIGTWMLVSNVAIINSPTPDERKLWGVSWAIILYGIFVGLCTNIVGKDTKNRNKTARKIIAASRHVVHEAGIPTLTKERVEARLRIEQTLRDKLHRAKITWEQEDSDRLTKLLFEDLNREPLITALISDRALLTVTEIESALRQIETQTLTPIQDGWL